MRLSTLIARLTVMLGQAIFICASVVLAAEPEYLRIIGESTEYVVKKKEGKDFVIRRTMTACAKNKGSLQPLIPLAGVTPVAEIDVLEAMNDKDAIIVDMRDTHEYVAGTIPGAKGIPYTEVAGRMNELGCTKQDKGWNCDQAKKVFSFCNGAVCPQSSMAIKAIVRDGFPVGKIFYYRGGMLDWSALGFPIVEGDL